MRLLTAHKILIVAALALGACLLAWGIAHRVWPMVALGGAMLPAGAVYLRKLLKKPPIR